MDDILWSMVHLNHNKPQFYQNNGHKYLYTTLKSSFGNSIILFLDTYISWVTGQKNIKNLCLMNLLKESS